MRWDVWLRRDGAVMSGREEEKGWGCEGRDVIASDHLDHACRGNKIVAEGASSIAGALEKLTGLQTLNLE